jgi:hypothetical protein
VKVLKANKRRAALGTALVGTALVVLLGAADCTHGDSDSGKVDHSPADVIQFPDGFRNVAHKCDGPNMVYSGSSGSGDSLPASVYVVANDPRCH